MAAADVSLKALWHVVDGDVPGAFAVLTDHIQAADVPQREMFAIVWGYAATLADEDLGILGGLSPDAADLAWSIVAATRTNDIAGAWMAWLMADDGSCGGALGGLLAAATSVLRRMGDE